MRPPVAAQQIAERALDRLSAAERASADLPCRIAAGAELTPTDVHAIEGVMMLVGDSPEQQLARQLLGGDPMARSVAAAASETQAGSPANPPADAGEPLLDPPEPPQAPSPSPVTAAGAATGYPVLGRALDELNGFLASVDRDLGIEVRTAVEIGWRSSLDRVGRMATRQARAAKPVLLQLDPAAAAVSAAADLSGLDVEALISPAVEDVSRHVERRAEAVQAAVSARIGELFAVDISGVWPEPADVRSFLAGAMTAELRLRLDRLGDPDRIDPSTDVDPLLAPYQLTRDVLAFAGGADRADGTIRRDGIGRPLTARLTAGADSVPLGPGAIELVRDALVSWSDAGVTAAARRRAGAMISDDLRAELTEVASRMAGASEQPPLEQVTVHTWRLNWNGRAIENLPRHEALAGTVVASVSELQQLAEAAADPNEWPHVSHSHPGDHRYCHCGWDTRIELRAVQLALPVS